MVTPQQVPPWLRRMASAAIDTTWTWVSQLGAIGPDDRRGRRFGAFGKGSLIAFPPGAIYNERWIRIGSHTMIGPHVSLTAGMAPGQEMVSDPVVSIGDRTLIGQGSYIVGHFCIEIGDDIQTGPYVYITDQNHAYADPDVPIGRQWPVESSVSVGSGSWLGTGVIVLPGAADRAQRRRRCRVGRGGRAARPLCRRRRPGQGDQAVRGRRRLGGHRPRSQQQLAQH